MHRKEFLEFLQAAEAQRRCVGKDCMIVTDANVTEAARLDAIETAHKQNEGQTSHDVLACPECVSVTRETALLRESMRLQGVELPIGVL